MIGVGNMSLKENDAVGIAVQCKAPKRPACLPSAARRQNSQQSLSTSGEKNNDEGLGPTQQVPKSESSMIAEE